MIDEGASPGQIPSLRSLILDLPPSCVEFCPASPSFFLVGTYNLQKDDEAPPAPDDEDAAPTKPQTRNGSIVAFRLGDSNDIHHVQTEALPSAILDLHFNPNDGFQDLCCAVSSTATLAMFRFRPDQDKPLQHLRTMSMAMLSDDANRGDADGPADLLFLSFCWHPSRADIIAITTSAGNVHLVNLGLTGSGCWTLEANPAITHSLEAWCVAISPSTKVPEGDCGAFTVFSGGDDSTLSYRTRAGATTASETTETTDPDYFCGDAVAIRRKHDAGVTAILPLYREEGGTQLVVTGSYDDHIRLFSVTTGSSFGPGAARVLAEQNLGGGVWRLKLVSLGSKDATAGFVWQATILASCMHGGARIVQLSQSNMGIYGFRVVASFTEHQSMNYGSDFQPGQTQKLRVVSTSFYDKLLCLWEFGDA